MSHSLVSKSSVMYDARNQQSSLLTIIVRNVQFQHGLDFVNQHKVEFSAPMFANLNVEEQKGDLVDVFNFSLTEEEWDTFFNSQTLTSQSQYDKVIECALLYVKQNITPVFGLGVQDWNITQ